MQQGDKALLSVEDDGAGIASEALPHVFDLFFQAETSLDRPQGGLGIGLTLARRLVEVHGGTIQVASAGRGQGSRFAFQLPLLDGGCDAVTPESDTAQPAVAPLRVLLVEDNADAAETTAMMISLWGHEVALARDGDDALRQAATFSADVILLDIGLPKMDGYELAERLRQRLAGPPPWLVALSGYGAAERSDAGRESIFDCHLVKPVAPAALEALLADYAASRPAKGSRAPARGASSKPP